MTGVCPPTAEDQPGPHALRHHGQVLTCPPPDCSTNINELSQSQQYALFKQNAFEAIATCLLHHVLPIVSGAPVKLELPELLAIEGVALRSIASGRRCLFCSVKIPAVEREAMREQMTGRYII
jgi:hypothetical protein